jgi:hypothetical protein
VVVTAVLLTAQLAAMATQAPLLFGELRELRGKRAAIQLLD